MGRFSKQYPEELEKLITSKKAPSGWKFDKNEWWLEEHGLVMEKPVFPLPNGRYQLAWLNDSPGWGNSVVLKITGDKWELEGDYTLYQVTHLPCRSAVYTGCSPTKIDMSKFPVTPGASMPNVDGCSKKDYAVLFITGLESDVAIVQ